jgi:hypothetical protein
VLRLIWGDGAAHGVQLGGGKQVSAADGSHSPLVAIRDCYGGLSIEGQHQGRRMPCALAIQSGVRMHRVQHRGGRALAHLPAGAHNAGNERLLRCAVPGAPALRECAD